MKKPIRLAAAAGLFATLAGFSIAHAASNVTFVSGKGADTGACATQTNPCRTFFYALTQTNAGGEIKALDPANYAHPNSLIINKSVSLTGVEGASLVRTAGGGVIQITAPATAVVSISNLILDGFNRTAAAGVAISSASKVTIRNCVVRSFSNSGIGVFPTTPLKLLVEDTEVSNNGGVGVYASPGAGGSIEGVVNRVTASNNQMGVRIVGAAALTVTDSLMLNNSSDGILVGAFAAATGARKLRIGHTTISGSPRGIRIIPGFGYVAESVGNNFLAGNTVEVDGTLTPVAPR